MGNPTESSPSCEAVNSADLFSAEELTAIKVLTRRFEDVSAEEPDLQWDFYLVHWLRVQKFNVDRTETMIREAVKWKVEHNIKQLVEEDLDPGILEKLHVDLNGLTKDGYPITSANAGNFRVRQAISTFGKDAVSKFWTQVIAKSEDSILKARRRMDERNGSSSEDLTIKSYANSWLLMNMANLSLTEMMSIDVITMLASSFRNVVKYFPIIAGTVCCINANKFFDIAYKIVSPILNGSNMVVRVFGTVEDKWRPFVLNAIEPDQIKLILEGEPRK